MSKAERQTIALLAVVSGSLDTIEEFNLDSVNMPTILYAKDQCNKAIYHYPCSDSPDKLLKFIKECLTAYDLKLKNLPTLNYNSILLINICSIILNDVTERIRDKTKLEIIEPTKEAIVALHDRIDPLGINYEDYELADNLIQIMYKLIKF